LFSIADLAIVIGSRDTFDFGSPAVTMHCTVVLPVLSTPWLIPTAYVGLVLRLCWFHRCLRSIFNRSPVSVPALLQWQLSIASCSMSIASHCFMSVASSRCSCEVSPVLLALRSMPVNSQPVLVYHASLLAIVTSSLSGYSGTVGLLGSFDSSPVLAPALLQSSLSIALVSVSCCSPALSSCIDSSLVLACHCYRRCHGCNIPPL
jgi:hypothetical protein